jgi:hypothetical protein
MLCLLEVRSSFGSLLIMSNDTFLHPVSFRLIHFSVYPLLSRFSSASILFSIDSPSIWLLHPQARQVLHPPTRSLTSTGLFGLQSTDLQSYIHRLARFYIHRLMVLCLPARQVLHPPTYGPTFIRSSSLISTSLLGPESTSPPIHAPTVSRAYTSTAFQSSGIHQLANSCIHQ